MPKKAAIPGHGAKAATNALKTASAVAQAIDGIREIAQTVRTISEQQTARVEIEQRTRKEIASVHAVRDVLLEYLDRSFDERRANFAALFEKIDHAIGTGNVEFVAVTLDAVVKLAQSSPFKDLAHISTARTALKDKSRDWEF